METAQESLDLSIFSRLGLQKLFILSLHERGTLHSPGYLRRNAEIAKKKRHVKFAETKFSRFFMHIVPRTPPDSMLNGWTWQHWNKGQHWQGSNVGYVNLPLELVLLLDGVRVGRTLSSVDELLSEALSNALDVAEAGFPGTDGQQGNGLVDSSERGDIDGLATDGTGGSDTGGVLTGSAVDNGVNGNLDGVLVGHEVNDGESVVDDADGHELLAVVAAVHHEGVGETLNDGALGLAEALDGVAPGGMGKVDGRPDLHVIAVFHQPPCSRCQNFDETAVGIQLPTRVSRNSQGSYVKEISLISTSS